MFFRKRNKNNPLAIDIKDLEMQRYMACHVPELLGKTKLFVPAFLSKVTETYLKSPNPPILSPDNLLESSRFNEAKTVYYRIVRDTFARYQNLKKINNAVSVEAKSIILDFTRPGVCLRKPKKHSYKVGENIPLYPCEDCDKEVNCLPWYKYEW